MVDEIPATVDAALPRRQRAPRTTAPVTWHRFDEATFAFGRDRLTVEVGLLVGIYSPARSVMDAFRLRHLHGEDQAVGALRRWLAQPGHQPSELLALARHPSRRCGPVVQVFL